MEKPIFYCDCDGVLLNTIEVAFEIMRENGCDMNSSKEINYFFRKKLDWNEVFRKASYINNSIDRLRYIKESNIFKEIIILTKICSVFDEERVKRELFNDVLPDVRVITLQYGLDKALVVPARNNVLLDDEISNCKKWEENEGTAILFSTYMRNPRKNIISDLNELTSTKGVKKLLKTRNF